MSFEFIKKLPTPQEIREKYPTKTIWMYTGDSWEDIYDLPIMRRSARCLPENPINSW